MFNWIRRLLGCFCGDVVPSINQIISQEKEILEKIEKVENLLLDNNSKRARMSPRRKSSKAENSK